MIATIRNNTGAALELWNAGTKVAILSDGQAIHSAPITITQITRAGVIFARKTGSFVDGDSYLATFASNAVVFTGNRSSVTFR
jgi:hypothetical protein